MTFLTIQVRGISVLLKWRLKMIIDILSKTALNSLTSRTIIFFFYPIVSYSTPKCRYRLTWLTAWSIEVTFHTATVWIWSCESFAVMWAVTVTSFRTIPSVPVSRTCNSWKNKRSMDLKPLTWGNIPNQNYAKVVFRSSIQTF